MRDGRLDILQIATRDILGGAEGVARNLHEAYRSRGHGSWLAVGYKKGRDPNVFCVPNDQAAGPVARYFWRAHQRLQPYYGRRPGARLLCRLTHRLAEPGGWLDALRGREDFRYPGTKRIPEAIPRLPNVIHCHNLHGGYFDLRALPSLSHRFPVVLTLHDAWLLSGHCAHSLACERWREGCGQCPDLSLYPSVRRDATAFNWRLKRDVYARCKLHVATPCQWLMDKVRSSMLAPAVADARVIPYGIDLSVFYPADARGVRDGLGLPRDASVLVFAANGIRRNPWKDYRTLREAVARIGARTSGRRVLFVALGEDAPPERLGRAEVRFVPFTSDSKEVARWYQAADVYVHAARADTFPNAVLEALACGTPVVATCVGGIPEQVKSLSHASSHHRDLRTYPVEQATGILTDSGDAEAMAEAIESLVADERLRIQIADNAASDARARFDLNRQVDDYLTWYEGLLGGPALNGPVGQEERRVLAPVT